MHVDVCVDAIVEVHKFYFLLTLLSALTNYYTRYYVQIHIYRIGRGFSSGFKVSNAFSSSFFLQNHLAAAATTTTVI